MGPWQLCATRRANKLSKYQYLPSRFGRGLAVAWRLRLEACQASLGYMTLPPIYPCTEVSLTRLFAHSQFSSAPSLFFPFASQLLPSLAVPGTSRRDYDAQIHSLSFSLTRLLIRIVFARIPFHPPLGCLQSVLAALPLSSIITCFRSTSLSHPSSNPLPYFDSSPLHSPPGCAPIIRLLTFRSFPRPSLRITPSRRRLLPYPF
jgi:hypothetical protein